MAKTTCLNNEFLGDLSINTSTSARDIYLNIKHTDNTNAASHAKLLLTTGGASGGDPTLEVTNSNQLYYTLGLDNSDSDSFKIAASEALDSSTVFADHSGNITRPLQPAFFAYVDGDIFNVTGNGTVYYIVYNAESYDIGSNFSTATGIFTAPISGNYFLSSSGGCSGAATTTVVLNLVCSNYSYNSQYSRTSSLNTNNSFISTLDQMDAADTAKVSIASTGAGADTCDVFEGNEQWFSGILLN
jgi:hypothetical protein